MPQLCQARRCRRSGPAIEMVGAALKALREMQYFLSGTGELTRSRSLTQHTGDLSIMLGTGHVRSLPHKRWQRITQTAARELPAPAARVISWSALELQRFGLNCCCVSEARA